jgi:hypothetical protein
MSGRCGHAVIARLAVCERPLVTVTGVSRAVVGKVGGAIQPGRQAFTNDSAAKFIGHVEASFVGIALA